MFDDEDDFDEPSEHEVLVLADTSLPTQVINDAALQAPLPLGCELFSVAPHRPGQWLVQVHSDEPFDALPDLDDLIEALRAVPGVTSAKYR